MSLHVLVLSPYPQEISEPIVSAGDVMTASSAMPEQIDADFIVSYGFKQIIREPLLSRFAGRLINIHIAMLPFNRGYDPNLWSWIEDSPKGVSIHQIDAGIDTGPLLDQRAVSFDDGHTLRSSYDVLKAAAAKLFADKWPSIRSGSPAQPQAAGGSFHKAAAGAQIFKLLPLGYDTPVKDLPTPEDFANAAFLKKVEDDRQP